MAAPRDGVRVLLFAGTGAGSGKSLLSAGVARALRNLGLRVSCFMLGGPALHPAQAQLLQIACGHEPHALDPVTQSNIPAYLARHAANCDIAIVDGVKGLFDSCSRQQPGGDAGSDSCIHTNAWLARSIHASCVLVIDGASSVGSALALLKGHLELDKELHVPCMVLNRVASSAGGVTAASMQSAIRNAGLDTRVLGCMPKAAFAASATAAERVDMMAALVSRQLDLEALLQACPPRPLDGRDRDSTGGSAAAGLVHAMARAARASSLVPAAFSGGSFSSSNNSSSHHGSGGTGSEEARPHPIIAVASDDAFGASFPGNVSAVEAAGARVVFFSPLHDTCLPTGCTGVYLGGAAQLASHAASLAANTSMRAAVRAFSEAGGLLLAESAGLLYLSQSLEGVTTDAGPWKVQQAQQGWMHSDAPIQTWPMAGVFPFKACLSPPGVPATEGYVELEAQPAVAALLGLPKRAGSSAGDGGFGTSSVTGSQQAGTPKAGAGTGSAHGGQLALALSTMRGYYHSNAEIVEERRHGQGPLGWRQQGLPGLHGGAITPGGGSEEAEPYVSAFRACAHTGAVTAGGAAPGGHTPGNASSHHHGSSAHQQQHQQKATWLTGYCRRGVLASAVLLHLGSMPELVQAWVEACARVDAGAVSAAVGKAVAAMVVPCTGDVAGVPCAGNCKSHSASTGASPTCHNKLQPISAAAAAAEHPWHAGKAAAQQPHAPAGLHMRVPSQDGTLPVVAGTGVVSGSLAGNPAGALPSNLSDLDLQRYVTTHGRALPHPAAHDAHAHCHSAPHYHPQHHLGHPGNPQGSADALAASAGFSGSAGQGQIMIQLSPRGLGLPMGGPGASMGGMQGQQHHLSAASSMSGFPSSTYPSEGVRRRLALSARSSIDDLFTLPGGYGSSAAGVAGGSRVSMGTGPLGHGMGDGADRHYQHRRQTSGLSHVAEDEVGGHHPLSGQQQPQQPAPWSYTFSPSQGGPGTGGGMGAGSMGVHMPEPNKAGLRRASSGCNMSRPPSQGALSTAYSSNTGAASLGTSHGALGLLEDAKLAQLGLPPLHGKTHSKLIGLACPLKAPSSGAASAGGAGSHPHPLMGGVTSLSAAASRVTTRSNTPEPFLGSQGHGAPGSAGAELFSAVGGPWGSTHAAPQTGSLYAGGGSHAGSTTQLARCGSQLSTTLEEAYLGGGVSCSGGAAAASSHKQQQQQQQAPSSTASSPLRLQGMLAPPHAIHHASSGLHVGPSGGLHGSSSMFGGTAGPAMHSDAIVSMCPGATEALVAMGLAGRLAGVSDGCDWPPDIRGAKALVCRRAAALAAGASKGRDQGSNGSEQGTGTAGGGASGAPLMVDEDLLRESNPSLVVLPALEGLARSDQLTLQRALQRTVLSSAAAAAAATGASGGPCIVLQHACRTLADVVDSVVQLGDAAAAPQAAGVLADRMRARLRAVAAHAAMHPPRLLTFAPTPTASASGYGQARGAGQQLQAVAAAGGRPPRMLVLASLLPLVRAGRWVPEILRLIGCGDDDEGTAWALRAAATGGLTVSGSGAANASGLGSSGGGNSNGGAGGSMSAAAVAALAASACLEPGDADAPLAWDTLRRMAPEILVIANTQDRALAAMAEVAALPGWWSLPAVHSGHVYLVEGGYLLRPGPRLVEGAEVLLRIVSTATQQQQALQLQRLGPGAGAAATAGAGAAGLPAYPRGAVLKLSLHGGQRCRQRLLPNYFMPV